MHYYTQVEIVGARIFASGTGYNHRSTMGEPGPTPPAVRGLFSIIARGGISAVKQMVIQEHYAKVLNRFQEADDDYDSDCPYGYE